MTIERELGNLSGVASVSVDVNAKQAVIRLVSPPTEAEIEAITDDARARVADYQMMLSLELRSHLHAAGVHVIGYQRLRQVMRSAIV